MSDLRRNFGDEHRGDHLPRLLAEIERALRKPYFRELIDDQEITEAASGGVWNDPAWQTWHRDAWVPACRAVGLEVARPCDLRHSFISLLIHEGSSVVEVARQAGHSPTMTLDVYSHVFDGFDIGERVSTTRSICRGSPS